MSTTCIKPFTRKVESNIYTLPCGKCPKCYQRRINGWTHRLLEEEKISSSSYFLTLTYDNEKVPIIENQTTKHCQLTLLKRDIQLFIKRLRKANKNTLKYFLCGEYGDKTMRPHYHMILFNAHEKTISKAWEKGHIYYGDVKPNSIVYTLKYMSKPSKIPMFDQDIRQKEFQLMSKGLGKSYIENAKNWHLEDLTDRMYCNVEEGKRIAMPRYYKDKLYTQEQRGDLKAYHTEQFTKELEELAYNPDLKSIIKNRNASFEHQMKKFKKNHLSRKN